MSFELNPQDVVIPITALEYDGVYAYIQYDLSEYEFFSIILINDEIIVLQNKSLPLLIKNFRKEVERINEELYEL